LKLWTLEDRRVRADLIEVLEMFCGLSVVVIDTFFELDKFSRTRGHFLKLKIVWFLISDRQHFYRMEPSGIICCWRWNDKYVQI